MPKSLNDIVEVTVVVSPLSIAATGFNLGLIIGKSTHIPVTDRVRVYAGYDEMVADGFLTSDPEYKSAVIYFSQSPRPKRLAVGRWDAGNSETAVNAVLACRTANPSWYAVYVCGAVKQEILDISAAVESMNPMSSFFYDSSDTDIAPGTAGNVMETLHALKRKKTYGLYSTYPYAGAGPMGYAMGANTGLANSAFTMAYKSIAGVLPEPLVETSSLAVPGISLSLSQVDKILSYGGNLYINYGSTYNLMVQGTMADGNHFDEILNLDVLTNELQISVINALISAPKISQTEDGVGMLTASLIASCDSARQRGAIGAGVWKGASILGLRTGDTLTTGYMILADSINSQSQSDRDNRIAPPIYVCVKLSGAIEHVTIAIIVNR